MALTHVPIAQCRAAPWYFDEPHIARNTYGRNVSEIVIQASIVKDLPRVIPCMVAAVPNGTHTASRYARMQRTKEGCAPGYPDLIIDGIGPNAGKVCRAEVKAMSAVSPEQFERLTQLDANGHLCGVFRSLDTLVGVLLANGWETRECTPIGEAANRVLGRLIIG
jgi:hypothetical protein